MNTPITYYGGKQKLAEKICSMIPDHKIYVEPFFGGGAVFFHKQPSYLEAINDINDNMVTFYRVCQDPQLFGELSDMIHSTLYSEAIHLQARAIWNRYMPASDVQRAWAVWVTCNWSHNATASGGWKWDMGTAGSHAGRVAAHKRNAFTEAVFDRLQYAQISCKDAISVIQQRDSDQTFFYLDPPYVGCDQKHYRGYTEENLEQLCSVLSGIKGKFILSGFPNDILTTHIQRNGWRYVEENMHLSVANYHNNAPVNKRRKTEVLIYNYQIPELDLF